MLKHVRVFGVRRALNQIIDMLNGGADQTRLGRIEATLDALSSSVHRLEARVRRLEKRTDKEEVFRMLDNMSASMDEEMLIHALEQIEGLEERLEALETNNTPDVRVGIPDAKAVADQIRRELRRRTGV